MQRHRFPPRKSAISCAGRTGVLGQHGFGGEDKARRAESALDRGLIDERLLDRVKALWSRQTFDGLDRPALGLVGQGAAGTDGRAIEEHRAGAADLGIARALGAGQPQSVAQKIEQNRPRLDLE